MIKLYCSELLDEWDEDEMKFEYVKRNDLNEFNLYDEHIHVMIRMNA